MAKINTDPKLTQPLEFEPKKPLLEETPFEEAVQNKRAYLTTDWLSSWPLWLRLVLAIGILLLAAGLVWQYLMPVKVWQANSRIPLNQMDLKKEAILLYNQSQLKEAIPKLEQVLKDNPRDVKAREMLVSSYWQEGKLAKALEHNSVLIKYKRFDADSLYRQGLIALQLNQVKTALKFLEQAAEQSPNSSNYHAELARALVKDKQYDRAINEWQYVLEILPPESSSAKALVWQQLADIYLIKGDKQKALEAVNKGLEVNPNSEYLKNKLLQVK